MRGQRAGIISAVLVGLLSFGWTTPAAAVECQDGPLTVIGEPLPVVGATGCAVGYYCGAPCDLTVTAVIEGIGLVGARIEFSSDRHGPQPPVVCGPAVNTCTAVLSQPNQIEGVFAGCSSNGIVAVQAVIRCTLTAT